MPYTIFALVMRIPNQTGSAVQNTLNLPPIALLVVAAFLFVLGFCIMTCISYLRFDVILYARTVNGIRKYFYENSGLKISDELRYRVLPRSILKPLYGDNFLGVIVVFSILDCSYLFFSLWWYLHQFRNTSTIVTLVILLLVIAISFILHITAFKLMARSQDKGITNIWIGIDIDGVVNIREEQFSKVLQLITGKAIDAKDIAKIPVSDYGKLGISEEEMKSVYNSPQYWADMPVRKDAAHNIKHIRNLVGIKVMLFTHQKDRGYTKWIEKVRFHYDWVTTCKHLTLKGVTKSWLKKEGIPFDKLIMERTNTKNSLLFRPKNRYNIFKNKKISFFIEDNLSNAIRLADIYEVVFLIDQPYNQDKDIKIPNNIMRIKSWKEILEFVRGRV